MEISLICSHKIDSLQFGHRLILSSITQHQFALIKKSDMHMFVYIRIRICSNASSYYPLIILRHESIRFDEKAGEICMRSREFGV